MKNIEYKLTYSWSISNICTVTDGMSGRSLRIDMAQNTCTGSLDAGIVLSEITSLIEILNTADEAKVWLMKNPTDYVDGLVIRDTGHFEWDLIEGGKYATLKNNKLTMNSSFNKSKALSMMYSTVSLLNHATKRLDPKRNIVRRIADCKLLVWVYNGHCVAVAERNIDGMAMSNALIDGEFYPALIVDTSREDNHCSVYDFNTGDLVFSCPLDISVTTYFKPSEELI